jgi:flagellar hook-length control protein FliK
MPVINAAANPVPIVSSPSVHGTAGATASSDDTSSGPPFASVLAKQVSEPTKTTTAAANANATTNQRDKSTEVPDADAAPMDLARIFLSFAPVAISPMVPATGTDAELAGADIGEQPLTAPDLSSLASLSVSSPVSSVVQTASLTPTTDPDASSSVVNRAPMDALDLGRTTAIPIEMPSATKTTVAAPSNEQSAYMPVVIATETAASRTVSDISDGKKNPVTPDVRLITPTGGSGVPLATMDEKGLPARLAGAQKVGALEGDQRGLQRAATSLEGGKQNLDETPATMLMHTTASAIRTAQEGEYRVAATVGSSHWESSVSNSLVMMSNARQDRAELVLTPPQLGRIEVSLSMKGDDATATFVSTNPVVREALENAIPRLRELLADAGITLGQTQVGSESPGQTARDGQNSDNSQRALNTADNATFQTGIVSHEVSTPTRLQIGLVDTYA